MGLGRVGHRRVANAVAEQELIGPGVGPGINRQDGIDVGVGSKAAVAAGVGCGVDRARAGDEANGVDLIGLKQVGAGFVIVAVQVVGREVGIQEPRVVVPLAIEREGSLARRRVR